MKNPNAGDGGGQGGRGPKFLFCSKPATVEEKRGHWEREE